MTSSERITLLRGTHLHFDFAETKTKKYIQQVGCSNKLNVTDWVGNQTISGLSGRIVEVRFKSTRKGFYENTNELMLQDGDIVAVEATPGHDIGIVSLTGDLVMRQMYKYGVDISTAEFKKIYRKAKEADIEKWKQAISLEYNTMLKAREITEDLKLDMKIGDVEYQGDNTKAIFYYIADDRVDFRELIKVFATTFKVRIEMKQIGARQEAGRIAGIGACGRELCCSTWIHNFNSVTTNAARIQEVSINPQKIAGQCSKLKCCLNFELECYLDAQEDFPPKEINLETEKGTAYYIKTDIYRKIMWYSFHPENIVDFTPLPVERVSEIIRLNKNGQKVKKLIDHGHQTVKPLTGDELGYQNDVGINSITRFDTAKSNKKKKRKGKKHKNNITNTQNIVKTD